VTFRIDAAGFGFWTARNRPIFENNSNSLDVGLVLDDMTVDEACLPAAIATLKDGCRNDP